MKEYKTVLADPAGNITLFVLDKVPAEERERLVREYMDADPSIEQTAFVTETILGGEGRIEMAGGEFCGNALRAFGLLMAMKRNITEYTEFLLECSGCDTPLKVQVDPERSYAAAQMPLPLETRSIREGSLRGELVVLPGIAHLILEGIAPDESVMDLAEPLFQSVKGIDAYGVCFLDPALPSLMPLVKVPAAGSLVWEGSCASGTMAAFFTKVRNCADGEYEASFIEPAGTLVARAVLEKGKCTEMFLGGEVSLK